MIISFQDSHIKNKYISKRKMASFSMQIYYIPHTCAYVYICEAVATFRISEYCCHISLIHNEQKNINSVYMRNI